MAMTVMRNGYAYAYTGNFYGLFTSFTGYFWRTVKLMTVRSASESENRG